MITRIVRGTEKLLLRVEDLLQRHLQDLQRRENEVLVHLADQLQLLRAQLVQARKDRDAWAEKAKVASALLADAERDLGIALDKKVRVVAAEAVGRSWPTNAAACALRSKLVALAHDAQQLGIGVQICAHPRSLDLMQALSPDTERVAGGATLVRRAKLGEVTIALVMDCPVGHVPAVAHADATEESL